MRGMEDRAAGLLIHTARFHTDISVLDDVDPTDAMLGADIIKRPEQPRRRQLTAVDSDRVAAQVIDLDILRTIRRLLHRPAPLEHIRRRFFPGILPDPAFITDV